MIYKKSQLKAKKIVPPFGTIFIAELHRKKINGSD